MSIKAPANNNNKKFKKKTAQRTTKKKHSLYTSHYKFIVCTAWIIKFSVLTELHSRLIERIISNRLQSLKKTETKGDICSASLAHSNKSWSRPQKPSSLDLFGSLYCSTSRSRSFQRFKGDV